MSPNAVVSLAHCSVTVTGCRFEGVVVTGVVCGVGDVVITSAGCSVGDTVTAVGCGVVGVVTGIAVGCGVGDIVSVKFKYELQVLRSITTGIRGERRSACNACSTSTFATSTKLLISQLAPAHIGKFVELIIALEHAFSKFRMRCCPPRAKHSLIVSGKLQIPVSTAPIPTAQFASRAPKSGNKAAGLPRSPNAAVSLAH